MAASVIAQRIGWSRGIDRHLSGRFYRPPVDIPVEVEAVQPYRWYQAGGLLLRAKGHRMITGPVSVLTGTGAIELNQRLIGRW